MSKILDKLFDQLVYNSGQQNFYICMEDYKHIVNNWNVNHPHIGMFEPCTIKELIATQKILGWYFNRPLILDNHKFPLIRRYNLCG